jgi:hypothetical protein
LNCRQSVIARSDPIPLSCPDQQTLALTRAGADLVPELAALADHLCAAERKTLERLLKRLVER